MSVETIETTAPADTAPAPVKANYRFPDAVQILRADAPLEDWLAARREGIGGSDVSAILGLNPWSSAYEVWLDKIGERDPLKQNAAMRWGHLHEPAMRQAFMEDTGLKVRSVGLLRSKEHPFMQITPDGLVEDGGLFESKTTTGWLSSEWENGQVPDHAELQVQHAMAVTGRTHAWVVGLIDGRDWNIRRVERDEALIADIIEIERQFWTENVLQRKEPALTANALDALKKQFSRAEERSILAPGDLVGTLKQRHTEAKDQIKHWEGEKATVEAEMRLLFGSANTLLDESDGETKLATLNQNGTFAESRFREEYPELAEELTIQKPALDMDRLKAEHPDEYNKHRARILRFATPKKGK